MPETDATTVTTSYDPAGAALGTNIISLEVTSAVVHALSVNNSNASTLISETKYILSSVLL